MTTDGPRRMRIRKGRVMHLVRPSSDGGRYLSLCTNNNLLGNPYPRADAPRDWWESERYWYPDCTKCPADPAATGTAGASTGAGET